MGKFTDLVGMGHAFAPGPSELANIFASWHPSKDSPDMIDFPESDDFEISPRAVTPGKNTRVEFSPDVAWKYTRVYGAVARIEETDARNTETAFRMDIACKFEFRADGRGNAVVSTLFALVRAYSSNAAITTAFPVMLGCPIVGIISANYGGSGRAQLDGWKPADVDEWRCFAPDTMISATDFGHFNNEWTCGWSLVVGGYAFATHSPIQNRINVARLRPPPEGPHIFIRNRRERINREDSIGHERAGPMKPPPFLGRISISGLKFRTGFAAWVQLGLRIRLSLPLLPGADVLSVFVMWITSGRADAQPHATHEGGGRV